MWHSKLVLEGSSFGRRYMIFYDRDYYCTFDTTNPFLLIMLFPKKIVEVQLSARRGNSYYVRGEDVVTTGFKLLRGTENMRQHQIPTIVATKAKILGHPTIVGVNVCDNIL